MGAPEPVRHLFVKGISKDTKDEDVFMIIEQKMFTIKKLKCVSNQRHCLSHINLPYLVLNSNLWPKGVFVRTYRSQQPGSK